MQRPFEAIDVALALLAAVVVVSVYAVICFDGSRALFTDDFQLQYLPTAIEVGRALRAGELPCLSPHSWSGGALAGEYQYGVFSPFEMCCAYLVAGLDGELRALAGALVLPSSCSRVAL